MTSTIKLQSPDYDGMRIFIGASITSGSTALTVSDGDFTAADVGRPILVFGAGASGARLVTTVSAVAGATSVTLAAAAGTTVSSVYAKVGTGTELALPVTNDREVASSLAAIITLFEGVNQILDFKQLRQVITLQGVITPLTAAEAGFKDQDGTGIPVFMRDEITRTRADTTRGLAGASASWLDEGTSGGNWGSTTLPAAERDSGTVRAPGSMRLIFDKYWDGDSNALADLFVYGVVADFAFGPRAGASFRSRIPYTLTFLVGTIQVGA